VLSVELPKPQHIRMGNWEQRPLSAEQQAYAALDAFASLLVHYEIEELPERLTLR
jgi:ribonuclease D